MSNDLKMPTHKASEVSSEKRVVDKRPLLKVAKRACKLYRIMTWQKVMAIAKLWL